MSDPTKADAYTEEDLREARNWLNQFGCCSVTFEHRALEIGVRVDQLLAAFRAEARRERDAEWAYLPIGQHHVKSDTPHKQGGCLVCDADAHWQQIRDEEVQSEREACERIVESRMVTYPSDSKQRIALSEALFFIRERAK